MAKDIFADRLKKIGGWIQTYSGKQFWPMDPNWEDISIIDIAVSLSRINRFTGHTIFPESVAQHSVYVSDILPAEYKKWGLLHDAHEAYVNDMVSPVKKFFPQYQEAETKLMNAVAKRFGLKIPVPKIIVEADYAVLAAEKDQIMGNEPASWGPLPKAANIKITEWTHEDAMYAFLSRFEKLFGTVEDYK